MLLVTFHGGSSGIQNVYCYDTAGGALLSPHALRGIPDNKLSELRGLVSANGYLYVVNGAKGLSNVLTFQHQSSEKSDHFHYVGVFVGAKLSRKGHFETAIAHPFALAFDGPATAYVSNQDTNVVAQIAVAADCRTGTVPTGCQSAYLTGLESKLCPSGGCTFLDGTFVASQQGKLRHVEVQAPSVPAEDGGLAVTPPNGQGSIQHSVRDVAVANGMLFVCDEPGMVVRLYALPRGQYLGASAVLPDKPTHLAVQNKGLLVSAGTGLYWSPLPASSTSPLPSFQPVLPSPNSPATFGGISFTADAASATGYVCVQSGTGKTGTGSIEAYTFTQPSADAPPTFVHEATLASNLRDTPEFVLCLPDPTT